MLGIDLSNDDDVLRANEESFYREWWSHTYAKLLVRRKLLRIGRLKDEVETTFRWLEQLSDRYGLIPQDVKNCPSTFKLRLTELSNCLVYDYHKLTQADGFDDFVYEAMSQSYGHPIRLLNTKDLVRVKCLHQLTTEFGFLITSLYLPFEPDISWKAFVERRTSAIAAIRQSNLFLYPRADDGSDVIQIKVDPYEPEIKDCWDLIVYVKVSDTMSKIQDAIKSCWEEEGRPEVGSKSECEITFYVDRRRCEKYHVCEVIKYQKYWRGSEISQSSNFLTPIIPKTVDLTVDEQKWLDSVASSSNPSDIPEPDANLLKKIRSFNKQVDGYNKKYKRFNAAYAKIIKYSEGLLEKRRDVKTDNLRRAVGLRIFITHKVTKNKESNSLRSIAAELFNLLDVGDVSGVRPHYNNENIQEVNKVMGTNYISDLERYNSRYNHFVLKKGVKKKPETQDAKKGIPIEDFEDFTYRCEEYFETTRDNIMRLMYDDYYLTEHCIDKGCYRPPLEDRKNKK